MSDQRNELKTSDSQIARAPEPADRLPSPFFAKWRQYKDAEHDFRHFKAMAPGLVPDLISRNRDFAVLKAYCGFFQDGSPTTVQVSFGHRLMGRLTIDDKVASEDGASLVYSFGPTGWIAVMLYPPHSQIARVNEDHIYLRIERACAARLLGSLSNDLNDLIRYERVASLDGSPRLGERLRIAWLRYWSRMQVNGQTKAARSSEHLRQVTDFSTGKLFLAFATALLKPIGVLIVIYLLIRFGMPELADLLLAKG